MHWIGVASGHCSARVSGLSSCIKCDDFRDWKLRNCVARQGTK